MKCSVSGNLPPLARARRTPCLPASVAPHQTAGFSPTMRRASPACRDRLASAAHLAHPRLAAAALSPRSDSAHRSAGAAPAHCTAAAPLRTRPALARHNALPTIARTGASRALRTPLAAHTPRSAVASPFPRKRSLSSLATLPIDLDVACPSATVHRLRLHSDAESRGINVCGRAASAPCVCLSLAPRSHLQTLQRSAFPASQVRINTARPYEYQTQFTTN